MRKKYYLLAKKYYRFPAESDFTTKLTKCLMPFLRWLRVATTMQSCWLYACLVRTTIAGEPNNKVKKLSSGTAGRTWTAEVTGRKKKDIDQEQGNP